MRPTVLVTGATGFVGRPVLRRLAAFSGADAVAVRPVVRRGGRELRFLPEGAECVVTPDLFAEPPDWWQRALLGVDTVLHLAWYAEPGRYLTSPLNLDCLAGTLALAKACCAAGVRRFVGVGTCFEYDVSAGTLSTRTPLAPASPYAAAKAAAFLALREHFGQAGISFAWCRLFYLYGDGEDARRLVPYVHERLRRGLPVELTSGNQVRDYLDVEAAAARLVEVALGDRSGPVNVCSGTGRTVRSLVEELADGHGRRDLLRFGARADNYTDPPFVVGSED